MMELAKGGELFDKLLEEGCLSEKMAAAGRTSLETNILQNYISSEFLTLVEVSLFF